MWAFVRLFLRSLTLWWCHCGWDDISQHVFQLGVSLWLSLLIGNVTRNSVCVPLGSLPFISLRSTLPCTLPFWLVGMKVTAITLGTTENKASLGLGPRKTCLKHSHYSLGCLRWTRWHNNTILALKSSDIWGLLTQPTLAWCRYQPWVHTFWERTPVTMEYVPKRLQDWDKAGSCIVTLCHWLQKVQVLLPLRMCRPISCRLTLQNGYFLLYRPVCVLSQLLWGRESQWYGNLIMFFLLYSLLLVFKSEHFNIHCFSPQGLL